MAKHHDEDTDEDADAENVSHDTEEDESKEEDAIEESENKEEEEKTEHKEHSDHDHTHGGNVFKRAWCWALEHKKISLPLGVVVLLLLLTAIPFTRYAMAGVFLKQDLEVTVVDRQTSKPVSNAAVSFNGVTKATDGQGKAKLHVKVGSGDLAVTKQYYKPAEKSVTVPVTKAATASVELDATGRVVPVAVVNKISGKGVKGVTIEADKSKVVTDDDGKASIVLPPKEASVKGTLSGEGYNATEITVKITASEDAANTFSITPTGKIYFLSNATGKLDMVKSNLDGTDRQVVVAGTGKEDKGNTILFASRDWKHIAFVSKREGGEYPKLYLVESDTDKLTVMDEGTANFTMVAWVGDSLLYKVDRGGLNNWSPKLSALKTYTVSTKKLATIDEVGGEGVSYGWYATEYFNGFSVKDKAIAYGKSWYGNGGPIGDKKATFNTIQIDGSHKKAFKTYEIASIETRSADLGEVYISYQGVGGTLAHDTYEDGKLTAVTLTDEQYNEDYRNYLVSPSSSKTLWIEYRDGKNTFIVGDAAGKNGTSVGADEDYDAYGWYGDDYILVTRKASELHILPYAGLNGGVGSSLKISDYYKPNYGTYSGYGYGG